MSLESLVTELDKEFKDQFQNEESKSVYSVASKCKIILGKLEQKEFELGLVQITFSPGIKPSSYTAIAIKNSEGIRYYNPCNVKDGTRTLQNLAEIFPAHGKLWGEVAPRDGYKESFPKLMYPPTVAVKLDSSSPRLHN